MADFTDQQKFAVDWVNANRDRLSAHNRQIWEFAEPAWREYKSSQAYVDLLRKEGFEVEQGSGGMPTAFAARWGGDGPVVGTLVLAAAGWFSRLSFLRECGCSEYRRRCLRARAESSGNVYGENDVSSRESYGTRQ